MAWAAQDPSSPFDAVERLQILAFSYGYATHAAGDFWAHTLVNEFTEGSSRRSPNCSTTTATSPTACGTS